MSSLNLSLGPIPGAPILSIIFSQMVTINDDLCYHGKAALAHLFLLQSKLDDSMYWSMATKAPAPGWHERVVARAPYCVALGNRKADLMSEAIKIRTACQALVDIHNTWATHNEERKK